MPLQWHNTLVTDVLKMSHILNTLQNNVDSFALSMCAKLYDHHLVYILANWARQSLQTLKAGEAEVGGGTFILNPYLSKLPRHSCFPQCFIINDVTYTIIWRILTCKTKIPLINNSSLLPKYSLFWPALSCLIRESAKILQMSIEIM